MTFRALLGTVALAAALVTGCTSDGDPSRADAQADAKATATAPEQHPATIVDDVGRTVELQVPVQSVAVYNAFNVEFIRAIGAFDAVIGMDEGAAGASYAGYWGDFDASHTVGKGQAEPNYEQLAQLHPEVVVFPRNGAWEEAVEKLEPFGIDVVVITGWDLARHVFNVSLFGVMFDRQDEAAELNAFYTQYRDLLEERLEAVARKTVYLENEKDYTSPVPGSGWHDMIELGGGRNIFGDIVFGSAGHTSGSVHALDVDPEAIVSRDPDLIIKLTGGGYAPESAGDLPARAASLTERPAWAGLRAVQEGQVRVTGSFPMNACSKVIGALYVAKWLHPDVMAGIDPDAVMREWIETYQRVSLPDPDSYRAGIQ